MKSTSAPKPLDVAAAAENLRPNPADPVAAKFAELMAAHASHDQARIDLVMAEISGLAAAEQRRVTQPAERSQPERFIGPRLWKD